MSSAITISGWMVQLGALVDAAMWPIFWLMCAACLWLVWLRIQQVGWKRASMFCGLVLVCTKVIQVSQDAHWSPEGWASPIYWQRTGPVSGWMCFLYAGIACASILWLLFSNETSYQSVSGNKHNVPN